MGKPVRGREQRSHNLMSVDVGILGGTSRIENYGIYSPKSQT